MDHEGLSLSLRLRHPTMLPQGIIEGVGVVPHVAYTVGEARASPTGRALGGTHKDTYCAFSLVERTDSDVLSAVRVTNAWLEQRAGFIDTFVQAGGTLEYYISASCDRRLAIEIPATELALCARFRVTLGFEMLCQRHSGQEPP